MTNLLVHCTCMCKHKWPTVYSWAIGSCVHVQISVFTHCTRVYCTSATLRMYVFEYSRVCIRVFMYKWAFKLLVSGTVHVHVLYLPHPSLHSLTPPCTPSPLLASFPGRRGNGLATSASSNCYFRCLKVGSTNQIWERSHMTTVKPIEPSQSRPFHFNSGRSIVLV